MKIVVAEVELTGVNKESISFVENTFSVTIPAPTKNKYDARVFLLGKPILIYTIVYGDGSFISEARPFKYGVRESFYISKSAEYALIGYDEGLLGGSTKSIITGYGRTRYVYLNAVYTDEYNFCIYDKEGDFSHGRYIVKLDESVLGRRMLLVGEEWNVGDEQYIGGYLL